tara:strand:+ start:1394 stop:2527 length:1134 start_codon:yes stop_codon:yes gene_type:complete
MQVFSKHNNDLEPEEIARYARHISLPEVGVEGQRRLKASSIICIGTGGLGSPLLIYLAASGIGKIGIVDFDLVDESNLHRQIIHRQKSIGQSKAHSAYSTIAAINPYCEVKIYEKILNKDNALEIIKPYDIVCDCTDNFPSRYLINDACLILNKPNVYGSIERFKGQATVFNLDKTSPNLRDLIDEPPPPDLLPTCSEAGVLGVLPGIIGLIQATEVIKIITKIGTTLSGRLLIFDALSMKFREIKIKQKKDQELINELIEYEGFCFQKNQVKNISAADFKSLIETEEDNIFLIDVRNSSENEVNSISKSNLFPLNNIQDISNIKKIKDQSLGKEIYVYCQSGNRSKRAILKLKSHGIEAINIDGGIEAWNKLILSN